MNYKIIGGDQQEYGPVTTEQLRQWMDEGRVNGQILVQPEGQTSWHPLSSFPELAALLPPLAGTLPALAPTTIRPSPAVLPQIPNYLVQAILCTICCCVPLGIPAIVYAAQVNTKLALGDVAGAEQASKNAKMWGVGSPSSPGWRLRCFIWRSWGWGLPPKAV